MAAAPDPGAAVFISGEDAPMTLDPQCLELLQAINAIGSPFDTMDHLEARRRVQESVDRAQPYGGRFRSVEDGRFDGPGGSIGYRFYRPEDATEEPGPVLIYYHGGGMVFGSIDSHDPICRAIAEAVPCAVVSIDYRLAPETAFPGAVDDALAAFRWVAANADALGVDAARIAVGGDSAGGNLAAVVSNETRGDAVSPCFQWLVYPNTDYLAAGGSVDSFAEGYFLTRDAIAWFRDLYTPDPGVRTDPRCSPLRAHSLSGVAPALVTTAGFDPLKDEGRAYAEKLEAEGVPVEYVDYPGMIHGYLRAFAIVDVAGQTIRDSARSLRAAFGMS
jgi:acetyl esterase